MKKINFNQMTGVVFDYNGTLVFDAHLHVLAWSEVSNLVRGIPMSEEENHQMSGKNNEVILYWMNPNLSSQENKKLSLKKEEIYRHLVVDEQLPLVNGVESFFDVLKKQNIPFTIASASIKENIDFFVENYHLDQWINPSLIRYDDGSYANKIQMFKDAAQTIHSPIETTLIFEDSPTGIACAHEAGFKHIIQIKKDANAKDIPHTDFSIVDFTELL